MSPPPASAIWPRSAALRAPVAPRRVIDTTPSRPGLAPDGGFRRDGTFVAALAHDAAVLEEA
jgi:hypothetical protein